MTVSTGQPLEALAGSFPESFDFYHLGTVRTQAPAARDPAELLWSALERHTKVGVVIHGEPSGALIIAFERGLDPSMYMEMANVIAARMVRELDGASGAGTMISPPRLLPEKTLERLARFSHPDSVHHRSYIHADAGETQVIHAFLIPTPGGGGLDA